MMTRLRAWPRRRRADALLLGLLAVWGLAPLVVLAVHAVRFDERLTGADGIVAGDQLQYLAWVTDAGRHLLAGNLFTLPPGARVYAHPLFTLSGVLRWLGLPLVVAYWVWKPVAVLGLFAGAYAWARRLLGTDRGTSGAALVLSLFLFTPLAGLAAWSSGAFGSAHDGLLAVAAEMFPAGGLWGYLPTALAIGLTPLVLLAVERHLDRDRRTPSPRALEPRPRPGPSQLHPLALAAGGGLVISWLHPWQGIVLSLLLIALGVGGGARLRRAVLAPLLASVAPLGYYLLLGRLDASWRLASRNDVVPHPPLLALLLAVLPLAPIALAGLRRPGPTLSERALILWLAAIAVCYAALGTYPSHALEGASLPLAVLLVRGWRALRCPAAIGLVAIALCTLPGMAYLVKSFFDVERGASQQYYLTAAEARALDWVARDAPPGGVLARTIFAVGVPAQTDRAVWAGHEFWTRDYPARSSAVDALLGGRLGAGQAQALVALSRARLIVVDCGVSTNLEPLLAPLLRAVHRFGCATVYVVRQSA